MAVPMWSQQTQRYETAYIGRTLEDREENHYDDSDFYAIVWDDNDNCPKRIDYGSTRYPSPTSCVVDATPETRAKYEAWHQARNEEWGKQKAIEDTNTPDFGKWVRVVKGRKVPIGTEGEVFYYERDKYTRIYGPRCVVIDGPLSPLPSIALEGRKYGMRVGLRLKDGSRVFTSAENVEVILK